ncbi:response regulator [Bradyrhizobium sp.]|uniref:response regulator n=1 Tax=Bradyrhizobium sp. TaxID=376 RepID=UPI003C47D61F
MVRSLLPKIVVLVVEDEPLLRMNTVDMVEEAGFEAVGAANAKQAMTLLHDRDDIQIILSDIDMPPGMDGMDLVAIVRDRWPPIEIILVSGQIAAADVRLPERGKFFSKPYRSQDLVAVMHRMAI